VVNKRLWLRVNAAGSKQSVATQLNLNGALGYRLLEDSEFALVPGIGLRVGDAILFRLGVETSDWAASFAYDITYSSARLYNQGQGAYELGFYKIFKIHKRPKVLPVLLCPRF
jgi:hypothetical protein